jgi:hypothetical protein
LGDEAVISEQDRSGYFGASDASYIMGNWNTKTFKNWWLTKLGISSNAFHNVAMNAGTYYEHAILDVIGSPRKDHQIIIPEYRLRINLDGDGLGRIDEVKTHKYENAFKVTKGYRQQVQVQMFGKLTKEKVMPQARIWAYGLLPDDYENFFNAIDKGRLKDYPIEYDAEFIRMFLIRVKYLVSCLERGVFPDEGFAMQKNIKLY